MNKFVTLLLLTLFAAAFAGFQLPSLGRRWYIGGTFTKAMNNDGEVAANNIVGWDGEKFIPVATTGTNGPVRAVYVDTCRSVYIGGDFTEVDGVKTGPIAKFTLANKKWEAVGPVDVFTGERNVVNSISVDCANLDFSKDLLSCNICDVFIGGNFTINTGSKIGYNVAKYDKQDKKWQDLGYGAAGAVQQGETVRSIHKKGFGVTKSTKYLWVGGDFNGLKKYDLSSSAWDTGVAALNGRINTVYYLPNWWSTDEIFVGGKFEQDGCINVCKFDYAQNKWSAVGAGQRPGPTGEVNAVTISGDNLYVGGSFTAEGGRQYLSYINKGSLSTGQWAGLSNSDNTLATVYDFDVCSSTDAGCGGGDGSMAVVGPNGYLKFYHAAKSTYYTFNNGTNGQVLSIKSAYTLGAGNALSAKFAIVFACALFALLAMLF